MYRVSTSQYLHIVWCRVIIFEKMENVGKIIIVWGRKKIEIPDVNLDDTVRGLKIRIHKETGILPKHQKLLNLRTKGYVLNCFMTFSPFIFPHHNHMLIL